MTDIARAGALLARARTDRQRIRLPVELHPRDSAEAYAIQAAVDAALGAPAMAPAWKVGAPDARAPGATVRVELAGVGAA